MEKAKHIIKKLQKNGFQAVFAGGCVRDLLMSRSPKDIDIATNATPDEIEGLFEKTIPVGKQFGVIIVVIEREEFEVATFREDHGSDGRRPDYVTVSTMKMDALRRDFTINGMFLDPISDNFHDFVGGFSDLNNKIIRFIGNPEERIQEDKLRIMRGIRFAARFGFNIERESYQAIKNNAEMIKIPSKERIFDEIVKILKDEKYRNAINLLVNTGIMEHILPEISALNGLEQPKCYHPEGDVLEHTILALESLKTGSSIELKLATLLHDIGKSATKTNTDRIRFNGHAKVGAVIAENILKRLKVDNKTIKMVKFFVENHMKFTDVQKMRVSTLKRFMALDNFHELLELHYADCMASNKDLSNYNFIKEKLKDFKKVKPLITGKDLIDAGIKPGPIFKEILTGIMTEQLEGRINAREQAVKLIKEYSKI